MPRLSVFMMNAAFWPGFGLSVFSSSAAMTPKKPLVIVFAHHVLELVFRHWCHVVAARALLLGAGIALLLAFLPGRCVRAFCSINRHEVNIALAEKEVDDVVFLVE